MQTHKDRTARLATRGILLGGILFLIGGGLHPRVAHGIDEVDLAVADMASQDGWYLAHIITGLAFLVIGVSLVALVRHAWPDDSRLKTLGWVAVVGTALGALDSIPHTLLKTEVTELIAGGSTPLTQAHLVTQALATPAFGIGVGILAVYGARERLFGHWSVAVLGVLGGLGRGLAGPSVAAGQTGASVLFATGFFIAWFLVISGIVGLVRARRQGTTEITRTAAIAA